jgi:pyruvate/2-oxoglutarate dehydrogenase complex dihydrolipoamide acyltransferase (E2) component
MATMYSVQLKGDYRYPVIVVCGRRFTKVEPVRVQVGDMTDEIRDCQNLEITEIMEADVDQVDATNAARALAEEHGVDLQALAPGSGEEGRVLVADVEAAL